jgi:uridylate kinase
MKNKCERKKEEKMKKNVEKKMKIVLVVGSGLVTRALQAISRFGAWALVPSHPSLAKEEEVK